MRKLMFVFGLIFVLSGVVYGQSVSVTLTWTAPGDDGNVGTAAEYDIRYSQDIITDVNWDAAVQADNEPVPQIAGSPESFIVDGLSANSTYYFAVKTRDEAGNWSGLSNIASVDTPDTIPPEDIDDLEATSAIIP